MSHTNAATVFASSDRLTVDDLDLETESRAVWLAITDEAALMVRLTKSRLRDIIYRLRKREHRSDPLELLSVLIVNLAAFNVPEARARLIMLQLENVFARCYTGAAHRPLRVLDQEEATLEGRENELTMRRYCSDAVTPEQLVEEAAANEREAAVQLERAKELRRQARGLVAGARTLVSAGR